MPAFHFDRRRLRRATWATLLVWLFALAAGVVNACALTPRGAVDGVDPQAGIVVHDKHASKPTAAGHPCHHAQVDEVDHHGHGHGHGHGQDSGKVSCLKFCDDECSAIAKVKLPVVGLGSTLLTVAEPWSAIVAAACAGVRHSPGRPSAQGPPLVIRFLRLTL
ncbi:MAG: hypothetical protein HY021_04945 [Burkholderiales bacterium]|nr:hypothetical protein [Burkholderiales bacterium]